MDIRTVSRASNDRRVQRARATSAPAVTSELQRRWYVLVTQARLVFAVEKQIEHAGFRAFVPSYQCLTWNPRSHRKNLEVSRPLLGGYAFVHFDPVRDAWQRTLKFIGVDEIMGERKGDRVVPIPVPDREIAEILVRAGSNYGVRRDGRVRAFEQGEMVRLNDGPFCGHNAVVDRMLDAGLDESERMAVLLDLMGRAVRIEIPTSSAEHL